MPGDQSGMKDAECKLKRGWVCKDDKQDTHVFC